MEIIEVTAHFDTQGHVTPLNIVLKGTSYRIEDSGRRWEAKDGLHILVMLAENRIFHLIFDRGSGKWKLVRSDEQPSLPKI